MDEPIDCEVLLLRGAHPLDGVFDDAIIQVETGKGQERHGTSEDFLEQPIIAISKLTGPEGPLFQVMKKSHEAVYCLRKGTFTKDEAYQELLGALVYLATIAYTIKNADEG
jgi:hypothetical protein